MDFKGNSFGKDNNNNLEILLQIIKESVLELSDHPLLYVVLSYMNIPSILICIMSFVCSFLPLTNLY